MNQKFLLVPMFLASALPFSSAQEAKPAAPQQPAQPQPAQQPGGAPQVQFPGGQQPPQVPDQAVPKIKDYRAYEGAVKYVRRYEEVKEIETERIDYSAPVLATVGGEPITQDQYRVWLAFSSGQQGVRAAQLQRLTEQAIKRLASEGVDMKTFEVSDAEIDGKLRGEEEQARAQGEQALADYKKLVDESLGAGNYRKLIRATLSSEKLLLPPIVKKEGAEPQGLPVEAAELLSDKPELRDYLNQAYLSGNDFPAMFRTQFLMMLQEAQVARADIKYAIETKLPDGVFMTVNGEEVKTAEILGFIPETPDTRDLAIRLAIIYKAIDQDLAAKGKALSPERFQIMFEAHEAEYKGTLFPLQNLIRLRGFMTMPEYREYYKRRAAYQIMVADEVTDDVLHAHHEKYGKLFYENGKVSLDVLWSGLTEASASTGGDLNKAWAKAMESAQALVAELKSGKTPDDLRAAKMGDVYPLDASGKVLAKTRNELRNFLGENEYSIFINGYSLADDMFYNRLEGEVVGPVKANRTLLPGMSSRMGYITGKVIDFKKNSALKPFDAQRAMVEQDFLDLNFTFYAHECVRNAKIELTTLKG